MHSVLPEIPWMDGRPLYSLWFLTPTTVTAPCGNKNKNKNLNLKKKKEKKQQKKKTKKRKYIKQP